MLAFGSVFALIQTGYRTNNSGKTRETLPTQTLKTRERPSAKGTAGTVWESLDQFRFRTFPNHRQYWAIDRPGKLELTSGRGLVTRGERPAGKRFIILLISNSELYSVISRNIVISVSHFSCKIRLVVD